MIRVLVVDDSPVIREFLVHILNSRAELQVIATASDGDEAIEAVKSLEPDVISMDIHMPKMDGIEATRRIMETRPTPIVIVTASSSAKEVAETFRAIEAGALALVPRPAGTGHPVHEATVRQLVETVKLMSEVKVVRRWPRHQGQEIVPFVSPPAEMKTEPMQAEAKLVAMGASTGGPITLRTILSGLPREFAVPVLVVQHLMAGFVHGFAEWLAQSSDFPVCVAAHGAQLLPRQVYVAPDGIHLGVGPDARIVLSGSEAGNGHNKPSVSRLFHSVADVYGKDAVGVLLTGMGKDGAEELKMMKDKGAVTIVQDEGSCAIYGMPGEAVKLNAATYVLPPERIATALIGLVNRKKGVIPR